MSFGQEILTILLCAGATALTRFLPFLVFSGKKPTPRFVVYLGKVLPAAIFGMLVVYCLKGVDWGGGTHGWPEILGILVTAGLHLWKREMLLSIAGGTVVYMVVVQVVV